MANIKSTQPSDTKSSDTKKTLSDSYTLARKDLERKLLGSLNDYRQCIGVAPVTELQPELLDVCEIMKSVYSLVEEKEISPEEVNCRLSGNFSTLLKQDYNLAISGAETLFDLYLLLNCKNVNIYIQDMIKLHQATPRKEEILGDYLSIRGEGLAKLVELKKSELREERKQNRLLSTAMVGAAAIAFGLTGLIVGYSQRVPVSSTSQSVSDSSLVEKNVVRADLAECNKNLEQSRNYSNRITDDLFDTRIRAALSSQNPTSELTQLVASRLESAGGAIGVRGRSCDEALGNLYGALGAKDAELKARFVKDAKTLCGTIDPEKSYVVFEVKK